LQKQEETKPNELRHIRLIVAWQRRLLTGCFWMKEFTFVLFFESTQAAEFAQLRRLVLLLAGWSILFAVELI
jgi:hypothetical protein